MEIGVAPASPALVPDLAALARAARSELGGQRGGRLFLQIESIAEPLDDALVALIGGSHGTVLAGTIDGTAVGYAIIEAAGAEAFLRELYVDPEARAVGVGEALLDGSIAWARSRGCSGLGSYALPGARATKNFFEAAGMKARLLVVHRPL